MKIEFNEKKLNALLMDFYNCTKIPISLFDAKFKCIFYSIEKPDYCSNVDSTPGLEESCNDCNNQHFDLINKEKRILFYTCHAGICEVIAPILYENIVIAYLMLGRFRDKEHFYSSMKLVNAFSKKYNIDCKKQKDSYYKLPLFSHSEIYSSVNLLQSLIQYLWTENIISTHKDLLPQKIENYINENLTKNFTVDDLCKMFFMSKRTLYTIFHNEFQDTIKNYILKKRLHLAKKMLLTTRLSISEIAEQCGFNDYNYFTRIFTKKYSVTPTKMRKENKEISTVQ